MIEEFSNTLVMSLSSLLDEPVLALWRMATDDKVVSTLPIVHGTSGVVSFSPDYSLVAVGDYSGAITILETGTLFDELP